MTRLDVTALYTEINRLEALVSEQAQEIARLVEASTHAIDGLADVACVHGRAFDSNEYPDWDSHCSVCAAMRPLVRAALAARGGEGQG